MSVDLSWLPEWQLHVAATLAHADDLTGKVGELVEEYSATEDGLRLEEQRHGSVSLTVVTGVRPLPRALPLYVADALTTLRAAIEHTLYSEVEHATRRHLSEKEAGAIEMPASLTAELFQQWVNGRKSRGAPVALQHPSPLLERVRALQPYQRNKTPGEHPMKVLAAHTNLAKHRMPALAATKVGLILPDKAVPGLVVLANKDEPVRAGDVLISTPLGSAVAVSIWCPVIVQRPHTDEWRTVVKELDFLARWVRAVAIPTLITGTYDLPELPATFDTAVGHEDERAAIAAGSWVTADVRLSQRMQARLLRRDFPETLAATPEAPDVGVLRTWVESLPDDALLERADRLRFATSAEDARANIAAVRAMYAEATASVAAD